MTEIRFDCDDGDLVCRHCACKNVCDRLRSGDRYVHQRYVDEFSYDSGPQSYNGLGNDAANATFSYTVQAKAGWQLENVGAYGAARRSCLEVGGGATNVVGTGTFSQVGGSNSNNGGNGVTTIKKANPSSPPGSGSWTEEIAQNAFGNRVRQAYKNTYDSNGNVNGYIVTSSIRTDLAPLTGAAGSVGFDLTASTTASSQSAYVAAYPATITLAFSALQSVSPIPEPDSYLMMAASLGLIGFLGRRKSKQLV